MSGEDNHEIRRLNAVVQLLRDELQAERGEMKSGRIVVMRRGTRLSNTSNFVVKILVNEAVLLSAGESLVDEVLERAKIEIMNERERRSS